MKEREGNRNEGNKRKEKGRKGKEIEMKEREGNRNALRMKKLVCNVYLYDEG